MKPLSDRQIIVLGSNVYIFSADVHRVWRLPKSEVPAWLPAYLALRQEGLAPSEIEARIRQDYGVSSDELQSCLEQLQRAEVLDAEMEDDQRRLPMPESWRTYGWQAAWKYHESMFHSRFLDYAADGARQDTDLMRTYLDQEPMPPPYKDVSSGEGEPVRLRDHLVRESRDPSPTGAGVVGLDQLAAVVNITFGQLRTVAPRHLNHDPLLKKTSPSGGGRHPTEAYVFVFDVEGVAPGLYHYQVRSNELMPLRAGDLLTEFRAFAIRDHDQPRFGAKFGVVLTSVVDRSMFRYRGSRSYRVLHYDVGHLLRTFDMVASTEGLSTYANYGVDEANLERLLGLEPCVEVPLAAAVVGIR